MPPKTMIPCIDLVKEVQIKCLENSRKKWIIKITFHTNKLVLLLNILHKLDYIILVIIYIILYILYYISVLH